MKATTKSDKLRTDRNVFWGTFFHVIGKFLSTDTKQIPAFLEVTVFSNYFFCNRNGAL